MAELWLIFRIFSTILAAILKIFFCEIQNPQKANTFPRPFHGTELSHFVPVEVELWLPI